MYPGTRVIIQMDNRAQFRDAEEPLDVTPQLRNGRIIGLSRDGSGHGESGRRDKKRHQEHRVPQKLFPER